jgi:hypothetical protein
VGTREVTVILVQGQNASWSAPEPPTPSGGRGVMLGSPGELLTYVEEDRHALGQLQGRAELFRGIVGGRRRLPGILHPPALRCRRPGHAGCCSDSDPGAAAAAAWRCGAVRCGAAPGSQTSGWVLARSLARLSRLCALRLLALSGLPAPARSHSHRPLPAAGDTEIGLIPALSNALLAPWGSWLCLGAMPLATSPR